MNLLEPAILLRVVLGLLAVTLLARASWTSVRVLRFFHLGETTEGQLLLEKQLTLASALVRVAVVALPAGLVLSVLAAERLHTSLRGAMCGYGVLASNEWGFRALVVSLVAALAAGGAAQLFAMDASQRTPVLARTLAWVTLALFPLAAADFVLTTTFFLKLDLTAVVTCCSMEIADRVGGTTGVSGGAWGIGGSTNWLRLAGPVLLLAAALAHAASTYKPRTKPATLFGVAASVLGLLALPVGILFASLQTAPHWFEVPHHTCPFCLLRGDAHGLGYALFVALFAAATWTLGGAVARVLIWRGRAVDAETFATSRARRASLAWGVALVLALAPLVRYVSLTGTLLESP